MRRRDLGFLFFLFFIQNVFAQKLEQFYFEPTFIIKIHHPGAKRDNSFVLTDNHYFWIESKKTIYFKDLLPGINFGYRFKNNDIINFGVNADASATGFNFYSLADRSKTRTNSISKVEYSFASTQTNFSINYKRNIFLINSHIHKGNFTRGFLNFGMTYSYRPTYSSFYDEIGSYAIAADSTRINMEAYTSTKGSIDKKVAFKTYVGFELTFGKKKADWFNLSFGYSFSGKYAYTGNSVNISVINKTSTQNYLYLVSGSGNGFYFTISRRIFPFKNQKKYIAPNDTILKK